MSSTFKASKALLTLLVCAAFLLPAVPALAQPAIISNGNLDTWTTRVGADAPVGWLTIDDVLGFAGFPFATGSVTKTTMARSGSAAQLQTVNIPLAGVVPAGLWLGSSVKSLRNLPGGVPTTARPVALQFYYQLSGAKAVAELAGVKVLLSKTVGGTTTVVGGAAYVFPTLAATYTLVTIPLLYTSALTPDSVKIEFSTSNIATPTLGTVLRIDDISFTGTVTPTRDAALAAAITAAPNPSPDGRFMLNSTEPGLLTAPLAVLDATGRVVRQEAAPSKPAASRDLDLSNLPLGIYTVQLFTPRGVVTRKLSR